MNTGSFTIRRRMLRSLALSIVSVMLLISTIKIALPENNSVTIACVNFHAVWGDKATNLKRIKDYIAEAAKKGADIIIFPELALTGYDIEREVRMHKENAETIPGSSTNEIAVLTRQYGVYVVVGMPEISKNDPDVVYNSAAVVGPEGVIGSYAKLMPFGSEMKWCKKGEKPFAINTPWGPVGIAICYDSYMFPELPRYYAALGARLYLHITAISAFTEWKEYYQNQLEARAIENMMFVASSNLCGKDLTTNFPGTSFVVGPGDVAHVVKYYAGPASEDREEIVMAKVDLAKADRMRKNYPLFQRNRFSGMPDWRLKLYKAMLKTIDEKTDLGKYD